MTELIDENELYDLAEIFKVFGDSTRIRILFALFDEEKSVNEIAKQLNMTDSAFSHQLKILKQIKLVKAKRIVERIKYLTDDLELLGNNYRNLD